MPSYIRWSLNIFTCLECVLHYLGFYFIVVPISILRMNYFLWIINKGETCDEYNFSFFGVSQKCFIFNWLKKSKNIFILSIIRLISSNIKISLLCFNHVKKLYNFWKIANLKKCQFLFNLFQIYESLENGVLLVLE